jgi:uncharacterized coiled-coil DUF342 family protein
MLALAMLLTGPFAQAQQAGESPANTPSAAQQLNPEQQKMLQQFQQARQQTQQLQQQLGEIQKQTLAENPKLMKQQEAFRELLIDTMRDNGQQPEKKLDELESLQAKIQDNSRPEQERQQLFRKFQQQNQVFAQAQREALQTESVQEAQERLNKAILTAMKDQNPKTEQLIQKMNQARQQMMQIRQEAASYATQPGQ